MKIYFRVFGFITLFFIASVYAKPVQAALDTVVAASDTSQLILVTDTEKKLHAESAFNVVTTATDDILAELNKEKESLKDDQLKVYRMIEAHFVPHFDIDYIVKKIAGVTWRKANAEQKERIRAAILDWIIRFFVKTVQKYSDQTIDFLPIKDSDISIKYLDTNKRKLDEVKATVASNLKVGGADVKVVYELRKAYSPDELDWKVIDLNAEGLQMIINFRTQFKETVDRKGIDGTLQAFERLAQKFKEKNS